MNSLKIQNNQTFRLDEINYSGKESFLNNVSAYLLSGYRMIGLFPPDNNKPEKIIAILADSNSSSFFITGGEFAQDKLEFKSWAEAFPQTNYFECELAEKHGFLPLHHPWLRPVRKQNVISGNQPYQFYKLDGDEIHEVAVGPIHAGVIEPGHFRFQCHGELVYHLEINLGYQHRGVEAMMLNATPGQRLTLAESITGDTVIGHTYAHCSAIESLSNTPIGLKAQVIRSIAEELERVAMHLTGLGGVANDIGLALAASSYGRLRTLVINSLAELSGSRFGRGLFVYGGVRFDFDSGIIQRIISNLNTVRSDIRVINDFLFSSTGALVRFEKTGTVKQESALKIGLVGLAARSCGLELDTRINFPYGAYRYFPVSQITLSTGDVFARSRLRALEIDESFRFIFEQLENLPDGEIRTATGDIAPDSGVISITEGWRGEVVHCAFTNSNGGIAQYKIKDPSFNNWYGLTLALRDTGISDFPLCNKSFDLSYAGHDL